MFKMTAYNPRRKKKKNRIRTRTVIKGFICVSDAFLESKSTNYPLAKIPACICLISCRPFSTGT